MPNLNRVMLMGNLTREPEVKFTPKGTAVAQFGIAINRTYTPEGGEKREEVTFVDVQAWGRTAEVIVEFFKKGDPIYIEGRLKLEQWDDKTTGKKMSKLRVVCDSFEFLKSKGGYQPSDAEAAANLPAKDRTAHSAPKPPADPDLDVASDDIPF